MRLEVAAAVLAAGLAVAGCEKENEQSLKLRHTEVLDQNSPKRQENKSEGKKAQDQYEMQSASTVALYEETTDSVPKSKYLEANLAEQLVEDARLQHPRTDSRLLMRRTRSLARRNDWDKVLVYAHNDQTIPLSFMKGTSIDKILISEDSQKIVVISEYMAIKASERHNYNEWKLADGYFFGKVTNPTFRILDTRTGKIRDAEIRALNEMSKEEGFIGPDEFKLSPKGNHIAYTSVTSSRDGIKWSLVIADLRDGSSVEIEGSGTYCWYSDSQLIRNRETAATIFDTKGKVIGDVEEFADAYRIVGKHDNKLFVTFYNEETKLEDLYYMDTNTRQVAAVTPGYDPFVHQPAIKEVEERREMQVPIDKEAKRLFVKAIELMYTTSMRVDRASVQFESLFVDAQDCPPLPELFGSTHNRKVKEFYNQFRRHALAPVIAYFKIDSLELKENSPFITYLQKHGVQAWHYLAEGERHLPGKGYLEFFVIKDRNDDYKLMIDPGHHSGK